MKRPKKSSESAIVRKGVGKAKLRACAALRWHLGDAETGSPSPILADFESPDSAERFEKRCIIKWEVLGNSGKCGQTAQTACPSVFIRLPKSPLPLLSALRAFCKSAQREPGILWVPQVAVLRDLCEARAIPGKTQVCEYADLWHPEFTHGQTSTAMQNDQRAAFTAAAGCG
jgi:hypothetical protein